MSDSKTKLIIEGDSSDATKELGKLDDAVDQSTKGFVGMMAKGETLAESMSNSFAAAAAAMTAAAGFMVSNAITTASELEKLARMTGTGVEQFQAWAFAAESAGVDMEQFASISKDARERVGEFVRGEGGEMQAFFDKIAPKIGLTADELEHLSGPEILMKVKNALDQTNVSLNQQISFFEDIASDSSLLIPILADNAAQMQKLGDQAREMGIILSEVDVSRLKEADTAIKLLGKSFEAVSADLAVAFVPSIIAVGEGLRWLLENMVRPLIFGVEALGVTVGVTLDVLGRMVDFVTSPGQWTANGVRQLTADVNQFGDVADDVYTAIAARHAGLSDKLNKSPLPLGGGGGGTPKTGSGSNKKSKAEKPYIFDPEGDFFAAMDESRTKRLLDESEKAQRDYADAVIKQQAEIADAVKAARGILADIDPVIKAEQEWVRLLDIQLKAAGTVEISNEQLGQAYAKTMGGIQDSTKETGNIMHDVFSGAASQIEDAFVELATTGKLSFSSLADSVVADIARMSVRKGITEPLMGKLFGDGKDDKGLLGGFDISSFFGKDGGGGSLIDSISGFFGFADGGIMTSAGALPLNKYASGGVARSPQLALFGEGRMPEAFVPLPDGRRIPVAMQGGGGQTIYHVNVSPVFHVAGALDRRTQQQAAAEVGRQVNYAVRRSS